ncbi:uncharacterized protein LOC131250565 [Magnolia sinica]|uniref:uncharacterized protein LOC131250565 n=1 Tax=Magnolia sinica TaxID=86752 RepID=UPI002658774A|nr:uncharacterized protein LOC131250565 [Magnolia sinica]
MVVHQRSPDEAFDPLTRSPEGNPRQSLSRGKRGGETLSDTETELESDAGNESGDDDGGDKGDDDSDDSKDDDDDGGGGNRDGGDTGGSQDKRPLSPFTGEENFDYSTQDPNHGSRPGESRPCLVYNKTYTRKKLLQKKKTHKLSDFEEELLAKYMRNTSVRGKRAAVNPPAGQNGIDLSYHSILQSLSFHEASALFDCWNFWHPKQLFYKNSDCEREVG